MESSDSMSDELVTIATFASSFEANLARQRLAEVDIPTFVADEQTVGLAWHLSNALGGVRLQVRRGDATEALTTLAEQAVSEIPVSQNSEPSFRDAPNHLEFAVDISSPVPTSREQNAERARRGAVLGLLFWPLQLYVFWLLMKVLISREQLSPSNRRSAVIASIINLPVIIGSFLLFRKIASG